MCAGGMGTGLTAAPAPGRKERSSLEGFLSLPLQDYRSQSPGFCFFAGSQGSLGRTWAARVSGKQAGVASLPWAAAGAAGVQVRPAGQTGRARLSLNGTLLSLQPCQLGRVGQTSAIWGPRVREEDGSVDSSPVCPHSLSGEGFTDPSHLGSVSA